MSRPGEVFFVFRPAICRRPAASFGLTVRKLPAGDVSLRLHLWRAVAYLHIYRTAAGRKQ
jgi:hypothetical protein